MFRPLMDLTPLHQCGAPECHGSRPCRVAFAPSTITSRLRSVRSPRLPRLVRAPDRPSRSPWPLPTGRAGVSRPLWSMPRATTLQCPPTCTPSISSPTRSRRVERRRPPRIQLRLSLRDNASTDRTLARAPRGDVGAERFQTPTHPGGSPHRSVIWSTTRRFSGSAFANAPGRWQRNLLAGAPRTGPTNRHLPPAQHDMLTRRMPSFDTPGAQVDAHTVAHRVGGPILFQHRFEYLQANATTSSWSSACVSMRLSTNQVPWRRGYRLATARDCARLLLHGGS